MHLDKVTDFFYILQTFVSEYFKWTLAKSEYTMTFFEVGFITMPRYQSGGVLYVAQMIGNSTGFEMRFYFKSYCFRILKKKLLWAINGTWNNHFFQRNPSMLIGVFVILYKMIEVVWIRKKQIFFCKNKGTIHANSRKKNIFGIPYCIDIFLLIGEAPSGFITEVCADVFITDYFAWLLAVYGSVIGSND